MSIENAVLRRGIALFGGLGKVGLNLKFPDEFELYVLALELIDSSGDTLRYFIFPVNPSNIDEAKPEITNIKKTLNGVVSLSTPNFVPTDITLTGNFGRKFKVLLGEDYQDFANSFKDTSSGKLTKKSVIKGVGEFFDERVKSGYGCTKILEDIVNESKQLDDFGGMKTLVFHNLALGNSYIVKPMSLRFFQSQESNMIWNYSLTLKSVAPLEALLNQQQLEEVRFRLSMSGWVQNQTNRLMNKLTEVVSKTNTNFNL